MTTLTAPESRPEPPGRPLFVNGLRPARVRLRLPYLWHRHFNPVLPCGVLDVDLIATIPGKWAAVERALPGTADAPWWAFHWGPLVLAVRITY